MVQDKKKGELKERGNGEEVPEHIGLGHKDGQFIREQK